MGGVALYYTMVPFLCDTPRNRLWGYTKGVVSCQGGIYIIVWDAQTGCTVSLQGEFAQQRGHMTGRSLYYEKGFVPQRNHITRDHYLKEIQSSLARPCSPLLNSSNRPHIPSYDARSSFSSPATSKSGTSRLKCWQSLLEFTWKLNHLTKWHTCNLLI